MTCANVDALLELPTNDKLVANIVSCLVYALISKYNEYGKTSNFKHSHITQHFMQL